MESAVDPAAQPWWLLARVLIIATIALMGCLSACAGSVSIFLLRLPRVLQRAPIGVFDMESGRASTADPRAAYANGSDRAVEIAGCAAEIAERACNIALERMGRGAATRQDAATPFVVIREIGGGGSGGDAPHRE
ncbi:MAG: hypothetical protein M0R66_00465 [Candidatus Omnitrophica bacterium]|jgi:hypothetical protein|nr:hypothetical protein [Candidatus Omnitrophota bacterium]